MSDPGELSDSTDLADDGWVYEDFGDGMPTPIENPGL